MKKKEKGERNIYLPFDLQGFLWNLNLTPPPIKFLCMRLYSGTVIICSSGTIAQPLSVLFNMTFQTQVLCVWLRMAAATATLKWVDVLEAQFDKSWVDMDQLLKQVDEVKYYVHEVLWHSYRYLYKL